MRILIVDDDAEIRLIASFVLTDAGHEVCEAATIAEAAASLSANPPDVLLMDLMLGDDDGVVAAGTLLQDARTDRPRLVFLTGAVRPGQVSRMMEAGAAGIVHKPFDPTTLVATLDRILSDAS